MSRRRIVYLSINILITVAFALVSGFCFRESYLRFGEAFRDFGLSIAGFFCTIFGVQTSFYFGTVSETSAYLGLPNMIDFDSVKTLFVRFGYNFISAQNFVGYLKLVFGGVYLLPTVVILVALVVMIICILIKLNVGGYRTDHGKESTPLKVYKKLEAAVLYPTQRFIKGYFDDLKTDRIFKKIWMCLFVFSMNLPAIVLETVAVLYYVPLNFSLQVLGTQILKLIIDIQMIFRLPLAVWAILIFAFLRSYRQRIGSRRIGARYALNNKFVKNQMSVVNVITGLMRAGKTRFMTAAMILKQQQMRNQAYETLREIDMLFPRYDWQLLEDCIKWDIKRHKVYNVYTAGVFAQNFWSSFVRYREDSEYRAVYNRLVDEGRLPLPPFNYNVETYGTRNNGLKNERLQDCLVDYCKAYFIYAVPTSMIFSNYAISVRSELVDYGNWPVWCYRYFDEVDDSEQREYSHILDMDMLRLGKKMRKDNPQANAVEYGVFGITEGDKERGNQFDTNELKKSAETANQKNDNFNATAKMGGHLTNIRGKHYFFECLDMQRSPSLNADLVDISTKIAVGEASDVKLLMPWFNCMEILHGVLYSRFINFYNDYRVRRGDNILTVYLAKKFVSWLDGYYKKIYNLYGCAEQSLIVDDNRECKFYVLPKFIYSDVYSTGGLHGFFERKVEKSRVGIIDIATYHNTNASFEELEQQHAYMVQSWIDNLGSDD